tara:strand:+ start:136 stop:501 length:366 start_codon:yes stop_codon:yes gene_type:complete
MSKLEAATKPLEVFYDGTCPICRREVAFYRLQRGADSIAWRDISNEPDGCEIAIGLSKENGLEKFHVKEASGAIYSGGMAFVKVWLSLPLLYPLGKLFQFKAFSWVLDIAYSIFLKFRRRK